MLAEDDLAEVYNCRRKSKSHAQSEDEINIRPKVQAVEFKEETIESILENYVGCKWNNIAYYTARDIGNGTICNKTLFQLEFSYSSLSANIKTQKFG